MSVCVRVCIHQLADSEVGSVNLEQCCDCASKPGLSGSFSLAREVLECDLDKGLM